MNKKIHLSRAYLAAVMLLVLLLGFVAGTRSKEIYGLVGPLVGIRVETGTLNDDSLQSLYQTLKVTYNGSIDDKTLIEGAKHGMVSAVGDPYTVYFTPKEADQFNKELSGDIGAGIGAEIGVRNGQPTIIRTLEGHPAEKTGVYAGDVIVMVNDQNANGWTAEEAVREIRGEKGTTVKLAVERSGEVKEFTITRDIITNPSVSSELRGNVGILTISRFDEETVSLTRKKAAELKNRGMKKLILDMRGNGGGYLDAAPGVAGMWLDDELVVSVRANGGSNQRLNAQGDTLLAEVPTAIVLNGGSASATEILAAALKHYNAAKIVGETSFGKGTVQELLPLQGGSMLKVTIKRWYTPSGKNIDGKGIAPDIKADLTQKDLDAGRDPQLEAAIKSLE